MPAGRKRSANPLRTSGFTPPKYKKKVTVKSAYKKGPKRQATSSNTNRGEIQKRTDRYQVMIKNKLYCRRICPS